MNDRQRQFFLEKVKRVIGPLEGRILAVWGLSFKPNTDDLREAPSLTIVPALLKAKAHLRVYDPVAMEKAHGLFKRVKFAKNPYEAAHGADAVLILTEWNEFKQVDFKKLKGLMRQAVVIDGRNMYGNEELTDEGFAYYGMGRGEVLDFG